MYNVPIFYFTNLIQILHFKDYTYRYHTLQKNTLKSCLLKAKARRLSCDLIQIDLDKKPSVHEDLTTLRGRDELDLVRKHYVNKIK